MLVIGRASPSPNTFLFKAFCSGCGLQKPPGCSCSCCQSDLGLVRQKMEGAQIMPSFLPFVLQLLPLSPQRLLQKLSYSFPPPSHFSWCLVMSGVVPRGFTCTENLALGHVCEASKHRQLCKACLITPVTQNLIWVVHLQGRILPAGVSGLLHPAFPSYWRCCSQTVSWPAAEAAWEGETCPSVLKIRENFRRCLSYSAGMWWVTNQFQWSWSEDRKVLAVMWWQPLALCSFLHMLSPELLWLLLQRYPNYPWLIPGARFCVPRCHNHGRGVSAANAEMVFSASLWFACTGQRAGLCLGAAKVLNSKCWLTLISLSSWSLSRVFTSLS